LIFFVKLKTENQLNELIRFEAASDWNVVGAIDQWRVCLDGCFKAKGKHCEHVLWRAVPRLSI